MTWKTPLVRLFRGLGWHLSNDGLVRLHKADGYVPCPPNSYRVYAPWSEPAFAGLMQQIRPWTSVSDDRCYVLHQFAKQCAHLPGDFAECGVYKGGTAMLCARTLHDVGASEKLFHLFDTFQGMPEEAETDSAGHAPGDFGDTSLPAVRSRLTRFSNVRLHAGVIPATLSEVGDRAFAFIHLDLDLYQSTLEALRFFYPRMVKGATLVSDDYGFPRYKEAAKKAVDEFFADKPEPVIVLRTGQCLVIKH
jgi:O-methyltransferase